MRNLIRLAVLAMSLVLNLLLPGSRINIACAVEVTPTQFYLQFHQKCLIVSSPKALMPWRSKDSIARDQPMSDEEIEQVYPMIKDMMSKQITVISEEIKGDHATLKVTGKMPDFAAAVVENAKSPTTGTGKNTSASANKTAATAKTEQAVGVVLLVKEDGQWKMDHESWTSRSSSTTP